ncbi:hypothetical protein [Opitutus sp. ER46]|uniref:hypothetical protein n=1 Tax=Opitutus sp. ER46 TaxID=2161864 RepID=UPI000D31C4FD|nr:hypothetical protein [Opitutus sp. ER46]PTY00375.1 hypothetical protein DB354_01835 [Opitutus sp. ER46]
MKTIRIPASLLAALLGAAGTMAAPAAKVEAVVPESLRTEFRQAAVRTADWLVANQIKDPYDANCGRFMQLYTPETKTANHRATASWMVAAATMGVLMVYHRTEGKEYLQAALRAGQYLKSLQILDARQSENFGTIREYSPQTPWVYPRDAVTAAWGMLWLYEQSAQPDYRERAALFNRWFFDHAVRNGWPAWQWSVVDGKHDFLQGSFHGGSAGYFYDYARVTGDRTDLARGLRAIADAYLDRFVQPDGSMKVIYDAALGTYVEDGTRQAGMQKMHRHNDDFGSLALLQAYAAFGERKYLERVEAYARWLIGEQRPDGGYGRPDVPPAAATGPIMLVDLYRLTGKREYLESAVKAATYLLTQQEVHATDKRASGGVYGYGPTWESGEKRWLNIRTSSYAIVAWLKLEGVEQGPYYSVFDRHGHLPEWSTLR